MLRTGSTSAVRLLPKAKTVKVLPAISQYRTAPISQTAASRSYSAHRHTKGPRIARTPSDSRIAHPQRARRAQHASEKATSIVRSKETHSNTSEEQWPRTSTTEDEVTIPPIPDPSINTPAVVPKEPKDVLQSSDSDFSGATKLLSQSALVVTRQIEMINIFIGYEQANKYSLHAPSGELVGYVAEENQGFLVSGLQRQMLRTHRPFRATVMDLSGKPVLMIRRPFTWINSKASIYAVRGSCPAGQGAPQDSDLELIGEVQQRWHLYRRRYELFLRRPSEESDDDTFEQFAQIDSGLWAWTFMMQDAESRLVGAIDRNFRGFGREIFTDTGQYVLRFDSVGETATAGALLTDSNQTQTQAQKQETAKSSTAESTELVQSHGTRPLTLDERAVALATAVSIDFDYFSRHSEGMHGGGGMFPWFYMGGMGGGGGGEAAETPHGANEPQQGSADDGGFGAGVAGGAMGSGMDYPYGASESGSSDDGRFGQPPSQADNYPPPNQEGGWNSEQQSGDVWGEGNSDPWAGAGDTQQEEPGMFSGWGDDSGGGGWGGFFGGDGDGGGGGDW